MNLFYQPLLPQGVHHLDPDESKHAVRVLRKQKGDKLTIVDGTGIWYTAEIIDPDQKCCTFSVTEQRSEQPRPYKIHIAIAPTKNADRIEWFVEKAVEIGIDTITFVQCNNSERSHFKLDRLERLAVSAMKQSLKASLPQIRALTDFKPFLKTVTEDERFIGFVDVSNPLHLKDAITKGRSYCMLIGPEGDFTDEELTMSIAAGFRKVSLGPSRLRTETAGLAACHIFNLFNA